MLKRCYVVTTKCYPDYGGRGITVCDSWRSSFASFLADVGPKPSPAHSLDRFPNNDGNYEPGNVRWATKRENTTNRRNSNWITFKGERMHITTAAALYGINQFTLWDRLKKRGWTVERAITTPIRVRGARAK